MKYLLMVPAGLALLLMLGAGATLMTGCSTSPGARVSDGTVEMERQLNNIVSRTEASGKGAEISTAPPYVDRVEWPEGANRTLVWVLDHEKPYRVNDRVDGTDYQIESVSRTDETIIVWFTPAQ